VAAKDWAAVYECVAPSERKKGEAEWDKQKKSLDTPDGQAAMMLLGPMLGVTDKEQIKKMSCKQFFVAMLKKVSEMAGGKIDDQLAAFQKATIVSKKVEGNRCTLKIKSEGKEEDANLVKEEDRWYLTGIKPKAGGAAPAAPTAPATPATPAASDAPAAPVTPAATTMPVAPTTPAPAPEGTAPK